MMEIISKDDGSGMEVNAFPSYRDMLHPACGFLNDEYVLESSGAPGDQ